ncbi:MAG: hypothetical protein K8S23_10590 [Candidatus Cloacimonetes bacterium]|nr:hypothetical protein [Candidatus Cloacimonadota bacterium]
MKNILLLIVLAILIFSCKSTNNEEDYPCPVYSEDLETIVGITETDNSGQLNGNIDINDWYFQNQKSSSSMISAELDVFEVYFEDEQVVIHWDTESESEISHWNVLRTETNELVDPLTVNFETIEGHNTSEHVDYYLVDEIGFVNGTTYYYWLQMFEYSDLSELWGPVSIYIPEETIYSFGPAYPNPSNLEIKIPYSVEVNKKVTITIINTDGKLIDTLVNSEKNIGNYEAIWSVPSSAQGLYRCIFHVSQENHWYGDILIQ